jgi:hypothetical protein
MFARPDPSHTRTQVHSELTVSKEVGGPHLTTSTVAVHTGVRERTTQFWWGEQMGLRFA